MLPAFVLIPLVLGALLCAVLPLRERAVAYLALGVAVIAATAAVWLAVTVWLSGAPVDVVWSATLPVGLPGSVSLHVDALSALFLALLGLVPAVALLYSGGYLAGQPHSAIRRYFTCFLLFIAGMNVVVMASDWVLFLFAWEIMALASYLLVMWDWHEASNTRAAWVYLLTTHVAGGGILIAMCALSLIGGDFSFAGTGFALAELFASSPGYAHLLTGLFALGFAAKGAVYPLSFWLPGAYAAAPAPVSAVLSGLTAKMGIYGLIRLFFFMMPAGGNAALIWGLVLATLGACNMVIGNIRSLSELHARRLVAQSSIGQIGYIVLGLGMSLALAERAPLLSAVAFAGALFHLVNHAAFKSLLFLTTGCIERQAGTDDLRKLGGLIGALPGVAGMTLLGALAIAGTPPLNGFASKWLLYRAAVFGGLELPLLAIYGVIAIFISTVSLAAYLKYFGVVFLGAPAPSVAGRNSRRMGASLWVLGGACVVLGLWPAPVINAALAALAGSSNPGSFGRDVATASGLLGSVLGSSGYQPLAVLAGLALSALLVWALWQPGNRTVRATSPWFGGERLSDSEARYGAQHLFKPFLARYGALLRAWWEPRFQAPATLERAIDADHWLIGPVYRAYNWFTALTGSRHGGQPRRYAIWQLAAVVVVVSVLITVEGGLF